MDIIEILKNLLALVLAYWVLFFLAKGFNDARTLYKYQNNANDKALSWIVTIVFGPWWYVESLFGVHNDEDEQASYPKPEDLWEPPKDPRNDWIM